jgi:hypothetical protein
MLRVLRDLNLDFGEGQRAIAPHPKTLFNALWWGEWLNFGLSTVPND